MYKISFIRACKTDFFSGADLGLAYQGRQPQTNIIEAEPLLESLHQISYPPN